MEGSMDIDDLLNLHASDLEEDAARLDVMPCPVFPPAGRFFLFFFVAVVLFLSSYFVFLFTGSVQTLEVSHRVILGEVAKNSQLLS
jgi:hypothetical protein